MAVVAEPGRRQVTLEVYPELDDEGEALDVWKPLWATLLLFAGHSRLVQADYRVCLVCRSWMSPVCSDGAVLEFLSTLGIRCGSRSMSPTGI